MSENQTMTASAAAAVVDGKLPVADGAEVKAETARLIRQHRGGLGRVLALYILAAIAGLAGPFLLGRMVDAVVAGTTGTYVMWVSLILLGFVTVQAVLTRFATKSGMVLGEHVFAQLREEFMERVTSLPLSTVEKAGTGDLVTRTTNDIESVSHTVRFGVPQVLVSVAQIVFTVLAAIITSPVLALALLIGMPLLIPATRWYLKRATAGYLRERESYAVVKWGRHRNCRRGRDRRCTQPRSPAPAAAGRIAQGQLRGRAVYPQAADSAVPVRGLLLLDSGRRRAAVGRVAGQSGTGDAGRYRHRGAVCGAADRSD